MKYWIGLILSLCVNLACADTIASYIKIDSNIPQMELKPDEKSQAWANYAKAVIAATDETIAETLVIMNTMAAKNGKPIFCLPEKTKVTTTEMDDIIKKSYTFLGQNGMHTETMSVSEVAMLGFIKTYPCKS